MPPLNTDRLARILAASAPLEGLSPPDPERLLSPVHRGELTINDARWIQFAADLVAAVFETGEPPAVEPEPFFEPGKTYLTENRAFEFTCERVVDGVALGRERELDPRWNPPNRRVWHSVMPEGCWTEVAPPLDPDDVRIDVYRSGAEWDATTRLTHLPTGVMMTFYGGGLLDRERAMQDLAEKVAAHGADDPK